MQGKLAPIECKPFCLIIGIICGSITQMKPLLDDINQLSTYPFLRKISIHILANDEKAEPIKQAINKNLPAIEPENIHLWQHPDSTAQLPIGQARSELQKKIGEDIKNQHNSVAWLLDDDMRIPAIAKTYLTYLPKMKNNGTDVVLGCIDGGSPNPAAHGMLTQINDIIHNLSWLNNLSDTQILPDRVEENKKFRIQYPDYYYDLSRKHSDHLIKPYWLVKQNDAETVMDARVRMIGNLNKIFRGEPFMRPLINDIPTDPIAQAMPSCNRGGNCFILNAKALSNTPNSIPYSNGIQNRRSDMIWALINRYHYGLNIVQVNFPVYHHRFTALSEKYNLEKNIAEMIGSAIYASLQKFFINNPHANFIFTHSDMQKIIDLYRHYINRRLNQYRTNYIIINHLLDKLQNLNDVDNLFDVFIRRARSWADGKHIDMIAKICLQQNTTLLEYFYSLPEEIDNYISQSSCLEK